MKMGSKKEFHELFCVELKGKNRSKLNERLAKAVINQKFSYDGR